MSANANAFEGAVFALAEKVDREVERLRLAARHPGTYPWPKWRKEKIKQEMRDVFKEHGANTTHHMAALQEIMDLIDSYSEGEA